MNKRHFYIIICAILFGLIIEGLKSINGIPSQKNIAFSNATLKELDAKPFFISTNNAANVSQTNIIGSRRSSGLTLAGGRIVNQHDFSHKVDKAKTVADAKKEEKKKKKKKAGRGKKKDANETSVAKKSQEKQNNENSNSGVTNQTATEGVTPVAPANEAEEKIPVSYEDWAKLILGSPNAQNVVKLIDYFKSNLVTSEVFYAILNAMLEESNSEQHRLAVYAAGNVPNPQSFTFLLEVAINSGFPQSANKARDQINTYTTIHNVTHLKSVLEVNIAEPQVVLTALQTLERATQLHFENRSPSGEVEALDNQGDNENASADNSSTKAADLKRAYSGFEPILNRVIAAYRSQGEITQPAQKSLTRIKTLTVVLAETNI